MRIKDCIYGQVRSTEDEDLSQGVLMPHVVPNAWTDHIIQQQLFTWTNHTGMNPLWADSPVEDVTYFRYGEMLSEVDGSRTPAEWDEFVAAQGPDFTNVDIADTSAMVFDPSIFKYTRRAKLRLFNFKTARHKF
jgi:hypothetical protein